MLLMNPPAHNNILLGTAPPCSLFWCDFPKKTHSKACCQAPKGPKACPKGQACAVVQDEVQRLERASIPQLLMPLMGSEDLQNLLKNAAHCVLVPCYGNCA